MNEWKRILSHRKRALAFLCIPLVCVFLFFYQKCNGNFASLTAKSQEYRGMISAYEGFTPQEIVDDLKDNQYYNLEVMRLRKQAEHLAGYADYLELVKTQAAKMQGSSIFGSDPHSFTYRNIIKTAQDFDGLTADNISLGNDRAVLFWLGYSLSDWAFLVMILLLVMSFLEDRKKGLAAIIRSCPGGRGKLQMERMAILLCFSAVMTAALYYLPLGLSFLLDGGVEGLSRPVQSMAEFQKCTQSMTIAQFLIRFFFIKTACGFFLGILIWFLLSFLSQVQLAFFLTAAALGVEYLAYTLIPVQSWLSPLGQINVFSYIFTFGLFTQYRNINLFSFAVSRQGALMGILAVAVVVLSVATIVLLIRRYPFGNRDLLGKYIDIWNRFADTLRKPLGLYGMEWYKLLFLTASGIFLVLGFFGTKDIRASSGAYDDVRRVAYRQYLAEIQGPITEDTYAYIEEARQYLDTSPMSDGQLYMALDMLEMTLAQKGEGDWLVDEDTFMNVYGPESSWLQRKNAILAMLVLVACLSPLFACDQSGDLRKMIRSTPGGRNRFFRTKYAVAFTVTVLVWAMVFGREWIYAYRYLDVYIPHAPCHSIEFIKHLPGKVSTFLILLYLSKLLILLIPMHICIFLAEVTPNFEMAFFLGSITLLLPGAAYAFDVDALKLLTPVSFLADGNPLVASSGMIPLVIWAALSVTVVLAAQRHWCHNRV